MSEHARTPPRRAHGPFGTDEDHKLGEEALHFTRWFAQSKYHLMARFLGELRHASGERDARVLQERYCNALTHAQRVHQARAVVTFLLALGVVSAATSAVANALDVDVQAGLLERAAALAASASVLLVALRLLLDRYLERVDVTATFLAIQLATAPPPTR